MAPHAPQRPRRDLRVPGRDLALRAPEVDAQREHRVAEEVLEERPEKRQDRLQDNITNTSRQVNRKYTYPVNRKDYLRIDISDTCRTIYVMLKL